MNRRTTVGRNGKKSIGITSSPATSEEEDQSGFGDDDRDDFACVPANNMDNDTVHIKILDDDPRHIRDS